MADHRKSGASAGAAEGAGAGAGADQGSANGNGTIVDPATGQQQQQGQAEATQGGALGAAGAAAGVGGTQAGAVPVGPSAQDVADAEARLNETVPGGRYIVGEQEVDAFGQPLQQEEQDQSAQEEEASG